MEVKTKVKQKTKKQIEADFPIIKPENCPMELMKWTVEREARMLEKIEELIDMLFEKYFRKYITMIYGNRIWLYLLTAVVLGCIILYIITQ